MLSKSLPSNKRQVLRFRNQPARTTGIFAELQQKFVPARDL